MRQLSTISQKAIPIPRVPFLGITNRKRSNMPTLFLEQIDWLEHSSFPLRQSLSLKEWVWCLKSLLSWFQSKIIADKRGIITESEIQVNVSSKFSGINFILLNFQCVTGIKPMEDIHPGSSWLPDTIFKQNKHKGCLCLCISNATVLKKWWHAKANSNRT